MIFVRPTDRRSAGRLIAAGVVPFTFSIAGLEIRRFCIADSFAVAVLVTELGGLFTLDVTAGVRVLIFDKVRRVTDNRFNARLVEPAAVVFIRLLVGTALDGRPRPMVPQMLARRTNAADLPTMSPNSIRMTGKKMVSGHDMREQMSIDCGMLDKHRSVIE